ncbi:anthranilate synthase component I family protein [uncultured Campylobacter sp.]|uniref:anthranilate synthase component I family protein n=1 Tax=uncultured Campylobacter sp. TaxID=218934 RepID=UPI00262FDD1D|nr:anthranilate synthase component I family protein [uncultured Campylobacter sp.]
MLLEEPLFYYREILKTHPQSYLAEDDRQVIIGIDCDYFDGFKMSFEALRLKFDEVKGAKVGASEFKNASFAGLFGVLGYDIVRAFENIGAPKQALYDFPPFFYADAANYLHYDKISKIYDFYGKDAQIYESLRGLSLQASQQAAVETAAASQSAARTDAAIKGGSKSQGASEPEPKKKELKFKILTDLDAEESHFSAMVEAAKEKIKSGDVFQVVLGEILEVGTNLGSLEFYERLKKNNPSPYMFHFPTPYGCVAGSSPELIMEIKKDEIFVAPIAGTRSRGANAEADAALERELLSDEKELAEHRMLIDLARNDIGKFAAPASVRVQNAMRVVRYESVMHIVSEVYGSKPRGVSAFEVLGTIFPAGTLSGSPKIRAMQIINELERYERGIYGGGIGFWRFNGDVMQAILIRSAIFVNRDAQNFCSDEDFKRNSNLNLNAACGEEKSEATELCDFAAQKSSDVAQNLRPRAGEHEATLNLKARAGGGALNLESEPSFSRAMRFEVAKFNAENFGCEGLSNLVFIGAGAGIVYDSSPKSEYAEICKKRKSPLKAIEELCEEA